MRAKNGERVVATGEMGHENSGGKERKGFQKICRSTVYTASQALQRRHFFFSITGGPAVSVLMADEMGGGDQMSNSQDDAAD